MNFAICLVIVTILAFTCNGFIKKNANVLYILSGIISIGVIACTALNISNQFPQWVRTIIWTPFAWGGFATAIFVVVMFVGAVGHGSVIQKKLMPIRAELSIIASILTLGHNLSAGQTYFVFLFTEPSKLQGSQLMATICSILMLCIMLPLFITSFPKVRCKMPARKWKTLQRSAYVFYALIYVHVLLLYIPKARLGNTSAMLNVAMFSLIFMVYGVMRIRKALKNNIMAMKNVPVVAAVLICVAVTALSMPKNHVEANAMSAENVSNKTIQEKDENVEQLTESNEEMKQENIESELPSEDDTVEKEQDDASVKNVDTAQEEQKVELTQQKENDKQTSTQQNTKETVAQPKENKTATPQNDKKKEEPVPQSKSVQESAPAKTPEPAAPEPPAALTPEPPTPPAPEPPAVTYKYKNGTFTGTGSGYNGDITVNVTIQDDVISGISVVSHSDDEPFWSDGQAVISSILSAQSTNVNTVSGATFSSGGIKQAVASALSSAEN